jgi:predicted NAD/FAD-binding protein
VAVLCVVVGGAELPDVRVGTPVASIRRSGDGVLLTTQAQEQLVYDAVVLATHTDISLKLLGDTATAEETAVLGAIPYSNNDIYLHTGGGLSDVLQCAGLLPCSECLQSSDRGRPPAGCRWLGGGSGQ